MESDSWRPVHHNLMPKSRLCCLSRKTKSERGTFKGAALADLKSVHTGHLGWGHSLLFLACGWVQIRDYGHAPASKRRPVGRNAQVNRAVILHYSYLICFSQQMHARGVVIRAHVCRPFYQRKDGLKETIPKIRQHVPSGVRRGARVCHLELATLQHPWLL